MTDQNLTTRDLAGASEAESSAEQTAPDRDRPIGPTDDGAARSEGAPSDEPLTRDQSDNEIGDAALPGDRSEAAAAAAGLGPLLSHDQSEHFTTRWREIQTSFVDQPRDSVEQADALVADLMQRLAAGFSNERERLEEQWDRGDDVSTEDLRVALTRYRSFFDRLLSA
jgi:hypothetical protein